MVSASKDEDEVLYIFPDRMHVEFSLGKVAVDANKPLS